MEIVPFSGIQILDFEIDLAKFEKPRKQFGLKGGILYPISKQSNNNAYDEEFSETYSQVITQFEEKWLPAPLFRFSGTAQDGLKQYDEGPSTWARMRAKIQSRNEKGEPSLVVCQLAIDTSIDLDNDPRLSGNDYYLMPSERDVLAEKEFHFVSEASQMDWFLDSQIEEGGVWIDTQEWVAEWITDILKSKGLKGGQISLERIWSKYFTLVEIFGGLGIPSLKLLDTLSDNKRYTPIDTDFVVDTGNSRTCGILLEKPDNQETKIETAIPFKIRDFENAEVYREGLLESRIELAQAYFGRDDLAKKTGRMEAFLWPSPVRIGREAQSIQMQNKTTDTASGLSSAKRYLWDQAAVEREWRFSRSGSASLPSIATQTKQIMNEAGDLRSATEPPARDIRFSRSSFMTFMIAELIAHAFSQINNPIERSKRPNSSIPRRLSRVILTIPTAMPAREQSILRRRATEALDYVWKMLQLPHDNPIYAKPQLLIDWDEASCSQQVFLFNEISEVYSNQVRSYFADFGKKRVIEGENQNSLRIASVDIGGGTSDLMITTYFCKGDNEVIHPIQEFREGFRVAGDDILYGIIRDAIIPGLVKHLEGFGSSNAEKAFADFFQSVDDSKTSIKANFVNTILVPQAIAVLEKFESNELIVRIDAKNPMSHNHGCFANLLNELAKASGLAEWPDSAVMLELNAPQFKSIVDNVISKVVQNVSIALSNFRCDYVLLTGRPSKQPYIRELFENKLIVAPDRLISLHDYSVGAWYPFREPLSGKIGDPKSTVVVGALLNSVASFQLTNYSFKSEKLTLSSTANFIGELETSGQLRNRKIIVDNVNEKQREEFDFEFTNPVHLGARQIDDENWSTCPLYRLSAPSTGLGKFTLPLKLTLRRRSDVFFNDGDGLSNKAEQEEIEIFEIVDQEGRFAPSSTLKLEFNTLGKVDNYWLETGLFI